MNVAACVVMLMRLGVFFAPLLHFFLPLLELIAIDPLHHRIIGEIIDLSREFRAVNLCGILLGPFFHFLCLLFPLFYLGFGLLSFIFLRGFVASISRPWA